MRPELYQQFLSLKEQGIKIEAKAVLNEFIASFHSLDEKRYWIHGFLESEDFGQKIRHEIYTNLVFPVLLEGYSHKDAWSTLWLAKTSQNLYADEVLHAAVGFKSEFQLLREAYALEPTEGVRRLLLEAQINWFEYCQHEWPAGILYGADGGSPEECEEILREVQSARKLDQTGIHTLFLDDFEAKVREYRGRSFNKMTPETN